MRSGASCILAERTNERTSLLIAYHPKSKPLAAEKAAPVVDGDGLDTHPHMHESRTIYMTRPMSSSTHPNRNTYRRRAFDHSLARLASRRCTHTHIHTHTHIRAPTTCSCGRVGGEVIGVRPSGLYRPLSDSDIPGLPAIGAEEQVDAAVVGLELVAEVAIAHLANARCAVCGQRWVDATSAGMADVDVATNVNPKKLI